MLAFNPLKENCTGCGACYSVCPKKCITMVADEEGFLYPSASDACVSCGLCETVCPAPEYRPPTTDTPKVYAAVSRDKDIWLRSASGGAFSEICLSWADQDTLIVGAAWDGLNVHHVGIVGTENLALLCKSKYVFSSTGETFQQIKTHLKEGRKAVFCGTPCQVDGLRHYLRHDDENLLLIDLICHGVGSPTVFKTCMEMMGQELGEEILSYQFRAKRAVYETDHLSLLTTKNGSYYITGDYYIQLFLAQNCLRPSCGKNCRYRNQKRTGDITLADFKGLLEVFPELRGTKRNYSSVIVNTRKGSTVIPALHRTMQLIPATIEDIKKYNPLFCRQTWFSEDRDSFFQHFQNDPKAAVAKWTKPFSPVPKRTFKRKLFDKAPVWTRKMLLGLIKS